MHVICTCTYLSIYSGRLLKMKAQLTAETVTISSFSYFFLFFSCRLLKMKTQLTAETVARKIADETLEMQVKLMSELRLTIQV